jgi:EmrB/QacA subfamily drug resistance transporter
VSLPLRPRAGTPGPVAKSGRWTLIVVCAATFMLLVDITIVQVALPSMQRSLSASFPDLQWVISAYALSLSALLLTMGSLADRFGRQRLFVGGIVVFTLSSLACGLAPSAGLLIAARAVQGVGGAALFATGLSLIGQDFSGRQRANAIALWGATVGGAVAVGPLLGGVITSSLGWRWIFFVNVPVGVLTAGVSLLRVGNVRDPQATRVDLLGLATFSASLFLLVFGLTEGSGDGWTSPTVLAMLGSAALLMVAFVLVERAQRRPMLDLTLFRNRSFVGVSLTTFCIGGGMFALLPFLTLYLQNYLGLSPLQGGLRLLPMTVLAFFVPLASRRAVERAAPGRVLALGLLLGAAGLGLMQLISRGSAWTVLVPGLVVTGLGIGLANPAIARIALGVVPRERSGMASGISNTFRTGGLAVGIAALGALYQQSISSSLGQSLGHTVPGLAAAVAAGGVRAAGGHPALVAAVGAALNSSTKELFLIGTVALLAGSGFAVMVRARDFQRAAAVSETPARVEAGAVSA